MKVLGKAVIKSIPNCFIFLMLWPSLNIFANCQLNISKRLLDRMSSELKNMAYSKHTLDPCWEIDKCPDGNYGFVIRFTGVQFGNKKKGYFCPPYINQSVVYE